MITIPLALPLIPILWGIGILLGGIGIAAASGAFKDPKVNKLGVLGMQGSGKTLFLSYLRNIPFIGGVTSRTKYEQFKYKLSNDKEITISSGTDLGGGNMFRTDYNKILEESDVILYLFDIGRYLSNELDSDGDRYQRACNSRLEHIYSSIKKTKKPISVIATHKDKSGLSQNEMEQRFTALVQNKKYKGMLKNVEYINLTNSGEIKNLKGKLFKVN